MKRIKIGAILKMICLVDIVLCYAWLLVTVCAWCVSMFKYPSLVSFIDQSKKLVYILSNAVTTHLSYRIHFKSYWRNRHELWWNLKERHVIFALFVVAVYLCVICTSAFTSLVLIVRKDFKADSTEEALRLMVDLCFGHLNDIFSLLILVQGFFLIAVLMKMNYVRRQLREIESLAVRVTNESNMTSFPVFTMYENVVDTARRLCTDYGVCSLLWSLNVFGCVFFIIGWYCANHKANPSFLKYVVLPVFQHVSAACIFLNMSYESEEAHGKMKDALLELEMHVARSGTEKEFLDEIGFSLFLFSKHQFTTSVCGLYRMKRSVVLHMSGMVLSFCILLYQIA